MQKSTNLQYDNWIFLGNLMTTARYIFIMCSYNENSYSAMKRIRNWLSIIDSQSTETECTRSNVYIHIPAPGFIGNECIDRGQTAMPIADSYVRYTCVLIAVISTNIHIYASTYIYEYIYVYTLKNNVYPHNHRIVYTSFFFVHTKTVVVLYIYIYVYIHQIDNVYM